MIQYPGRPLRVGDDRREFVRLVQLALESAGVGPLSIDGIFGVNTRAAVQVFQVRQGLVPDGVVGAETWNALFSRADSPPLAHSTFATEVLKVAAGELGTRESGGPNRGPRVDEYIRNVGLDPTRGAYAWCAAFVYFCFTRASAALGRRNPCVKTAGCMEHWRRAPATARIPIDDVRLTPDAVPIGAIFMVDHGQGKGHTGLVEGIGRGVIHTIEGNTDAGGSREGDGVYRRTRPLDNINKGFIDYVRLPA